MPLRPSPILPFLALAGLFVPPAPASAQASLPTAAAFEGLRFRAIGPAVFAGRVNDLAVHEADPATMYVGTTTGGLWKTRDNGTTWEVLFNHLDGVVSIGDVTIAQDDPQVVWVGTGGTQSWGRGVFKSTDGGRTWQAMGLAGSRHVGRLVLDPRNRDVVYVAALGHAFAPSRERGVFKSTDGGRTWQHVLFVSEETGAFDLALDPSNPDIVYATTWQRRRTPFGNVTGGPESAIHKSLDGGRTWTRADRGLPEGARGVIGIDVFPRDPRVLYAVVDHPGGKDLFRSDDAGATWVKRNEPEDGRYRGHRMRWFDQVRVDPVDADRVYVLGVNLYMSSDGGRTFAINESAVQSGLWPETNGLYLFNTSTHSDHRAFWINPRNPAHLVSGSDGGVCISHRRGATWDCMNNMDLGQYYHVGVDMDEPYRVYGGLHDNLGWGGPSAVRSYLGIGAGEWFLVAGGDGLVAVADPSDSRIVYAESQNGNVSRVDRLTNERVPIRPEPAEGEPPYRWNFNTPLMLSPHDSKVVLIAANRLFRSEDRGHSWRAISPDLTAPPDPASLSVMGTPIATSPMGTRTPTWGTITTFTESPGRAGLYYVGADEGSVHVSRDGGASWVNVSTRFPGLPARTWVTKVAASSHAEGRAYASFSGHRTGDDRPYLFVTDDFGDTWRSIAAGFPGDHVIQTLTEDPRNADVLYAGTEFGLIVSLDRGVSWARVRSNLPTVPVYGIVVHPRANDLVLATFGRGIWILDDLGPVQQAAEAARAGGWLFDVRPARQFNPAHDRWWMWGDRRFWGENPPFGAGLAFVLDRPAREVRLVVRDGEGRIVREIDGQPGDPVPAGRITRVQWDLRATPLATPPAWQVPDGVVPFFSGAQARSHAYRAIDRKELDPRSAPFVLPGTYEVTLVADGRAIGTRRIDVRGDSLIDISDGDRRRLHATATKVHEMLGVAWGAAETVARIDGRRGRAARAIGQAPPDALRQAWAAFTTTADRVRQRLGLGLPGSPPGGEGAARNLPGALAGLKSQLLGATAAPTAIQQRRSDELRAALRAALEDLNAVATRALPAMEAQLRAAGLALETEPAIEAVAIPAWLADSDARPPR